MGNLSSLDIVLLAAAAYVIWRLIMRISANNRNMSDRTHDVTPENPDTAAQSSEDQRTRRAEAAWGYLRGGENVRAQPGLAQGTPPQPDLPGTFNEQEFLRGAKVMYGRIRQSLAMRNLDDLRQFVAPDLMAEFERQSAQSPDRTSLVVLLVEAKVVDLKRDGKKTEAQVAYHATISDDPKTNTSRQVDETWRFGRDETATDAKWLLESVG